MCLAEVLVLFAVASKLLDLRSLVQLKQSAAHLLIVDVGSRLSGLPGYECAADGHGAADGRDELAADGEARLHRPARLQRVRRAPLRLLRGVFTLCAAPRPPLLFSAPLSAHCSTPAPRKTDRRTSTCTCTPYE